MENRVCVKCDSVLDQGTYAGVTVDLCPNCGGLWLDAGEIEKLGTAPPGELKKLQGILTGDPKSKPTPSELTTACVACDGTLRELVLGPIKVDFCGKCGGLFLDRGELDAGLTAARGSGDVAALLRLAAQAAQG